jgi:hypothetical protein
MILLNIYIYIYIYMYKKYLKYKLKYSNEKKKLNNTVEDVILVIL